MCTEPFRLPESVLIHSIGSILITVHGSFLNLGSCEVEVYAHHCWPWIEVSVNSKPLRQIIEFRVKFERIQFRRGRQSEEI